MRRLFLAALLSVLSLSAAEAATVTVTQTETGWLRLYNCPQLVCLDTGQAHGEDENDSVSYTMVSELTLDEADLSYHYASQPMEGMGYEMGTRQVYYTGNSTVRVTLNGREFQFSGPLSFFVGELWPAYTHRIYMTGGINWDIDTPMGRFLFGHYGERSIPYVTTPPPHTSTPELDLTFRPVQTPNSAIMGDNYAAVLYPDQFNLQIERDVPAPVPLPAGGALLAGALAALALWRRRTAD